MRRSITCGATVARAHHRCIEDMRRLIDASWAHVEAAGKDAAGSVETIVMTGSGCGAMVKDYAHLLERDPRYREKAARIGAMTRDICEVVDPEIHRLKLLLAAKPARRIAFHPPCTLQHAEKIRGVTARELAAAGFELSPVPDSHLCCGSAGADSILYPGLGGQR